MTHDAVLFFSKTWGALYLLIVFLAAVIWVYWPSRRRIYRDACITPFSDREDRPCR